MWWVYTSFGRFRCGALLCAAAGFLVLIMGVSSGAARSPSYDRTAIAPADTITVEGRVVSIGSEPFTRLRLVMKGGGGYILDFEASEPINLRRQGPTDVRIVGIPFVDMWQGREVRYLRVIEWRYRSR